MEITDIQTQRKTRTKENAGAAQRLSFATAELADESPLVVACFFRLWQDATESVAACCRWPRRRVRLAQDARTPTQDGKGTRDATRAALTAAGHESTMPKTDVEQPALFSPDEAPVVELPPDGTALPTTRELSKFIMFYRENIRQHSKPETTGVMRQIQRLLMKGVTMKQISTALKHYRDDPFRQQADPRHVKHIRSFFTREVINQWQRPVPAGRRGFRPRHSALDALEALQQLAPQPAAPAPMAPIIPTDDFDEVEEFRL